MFIKNLDFIIDGFQLKIDSLDLTNNKVNAIMGPSGSGKTTLFNVLIGIYKPKNWSWVIAGKEMTNLEIDQRQLGIVFQRPELFPHLTTEKNIQLVMQARKNENSESLQKLEKYKDILKLKKCWNTLAQNLSGGEAQRVSLLRAVMSNPLALLLDEPFSALDVELKSEVRKLTSLVIEELQIPTLLITHDILDANAMNANIVRIQNGVIGF